MKIAHAPVLPVEGIQAQLYEKYGNEYSYVCTTSIPSDLPVMLFDVYWDGERYVGAHYCKDTATVFSQHLPDFEELLFACVMDDRGYWAYSESHTDYREFKNGNIIQGGRNFTYANGEVRFFQPDEGVFTETY